MNSKIVRFSLLIVVALTAITFTAFNLNQKKPWPVAAKDAAKKNTVKSDANSLKEGQSLWSRNCQPCHGKKGLGDGPKAANLKTEPGNMSSADVLSQSDGSLFFKISTGRGDMPSFKKKLEGDDDVWNLVNYIRTLKK